MIELAAAFFLLGNSLKDAVDVCIKNLNDFQLAVALARIVERGDDGPIFENILSNTVIPLALSEGNRWLGSWAFWILRRRDLALKILVVGALFCFIRCFDFSHDQSPLNDIMWLHYIESPTVGGVNYDDPSLALLYSQLKGKSLRVAYEGRTEFNFVLRTARTLCRIG